MKFSAKDMHFKILNEKIRTSEDQDIIITECNGQRYIASGLSSKKISIYGVTGNATGAYLDGAELTVYGNAQDATGDTMNEGVIIINGSSGDATGYAMRGGKIFVRDNAGYRAGIHMKAFEKKLPLLIIGGTAGSFLGEYQAGGTIIVLGLNRNKVPVGNFCGTGMHGGSIYLRCDELPDNLPAQVSAKQADEGDIQKIRQDIIDFCGCFDIDPDTVLNHNFFILTPNTKNPYKQLYTYS